jgi:hypothetical protein
MYVRRKERGYKGEGEITRYNIYVNNQVALEEREGLVGESSRLRHNTGEGQHCQATVLRRKQRTD